jgi:hypothetical protein
MPHNFPEHDACCSCFSPFPSLTPRHLLPRDVKTSLPGVPRRKELFKIPASPPPGWELRTGSPAVYPQSRSCSFLRMELKYMGVEEGSMKPRRTDTVSLVPDRHQHAGCPSLIPHPAFRGNQMENSRKEHPPGLGTTLSSGARWVDAVLSKAIATFACSRSRSSSAGLAFWPG